MSEKMTLERFNSLLNLLDIEIQETERVLKSLESLHLKTYGPYQILIDGIGRCHQQKKSFLQEYGIHYEIPEKYLPVEDEILLGI